MIDLLLSLACYGVSQTPGGGSATTWVDGMPLATTTFSGNRRTDDVLLVDVQGGTVRVKPPRSMRPDLAGNGDDGWRTLTDVSITDQQIRGRFSFNWVNRPWVTINRMTGMVEMQANDVLAGGRSSFMGQCERQSQTQLF